MQETNLTLKVDDTWAFSADDLREVDILPLGPEGFHILYQNESCHAQVISADMERKTVLVRVEGQKHEIRLQDAFDELVEKLGLASDAALHLSDVAAPMPGLVLEVLVSDGQEVKAGEPLLVLEAMKMENVLKAPGDGKVKGVHVQEGEAVEKNQLMVDFL